MPPICGRHGLERATYVHATNAAAWAIVLFWQPIPQVIWSVSGPLASCLWVLFGFGWFMLLTSAMSFGLLELHGIPQALASAKGKKYKEPQLKAGGWYAGIRHPMYVGLVLGIRATPHMTAGHLLIAVGLSVYLLIGMHYEERDLAFRFEGYPRR